MRKYQLWWLFLLVFGAVCLLEAALFMFTGMTLFYAGPNSGHLLVRGLVGAICLFVAAICAHENAHIRKGEGNEG